MGAPNGRPAILVHGPMTGYLLPQATEERLREAGITLLAISRPGFGNSDVQLDRPAIDVGARAIYHLMDHLNIPACPAVGIVCGLAPIARFASQQPDRITALLGIGASVPLNDTYGVDHLPLLQRVIVQLAELSPAALEVVILRAIRAIPTGDMTAILRRQYGQCSADAEVIADPGRLQRLNSGARMILAMDPKVFLRDLQMMAHPWDQDLMRAGRPCHFLAGRQDPVFPPDMVAALGRRTGATIDSLDRAGQLVMFQDPVVVADAIQDLFKQPIGAVERAACREPPFVSSGRVGITMEG